MLENNTFYFLFFSLFENIIGNRFENIIGNRFVPTCLNPITGLDKDDRTEPVNFDKCIDQMKF